MPEPLELKNFTSEGDYYDFDLASCSRGYRLSIRTRMVRDRNLLDYTYNSNVFRPESTIVVMMRSEKVLETTDFRKALDTYNTLMDLDKDPIPQKGDVRT